MLTQIIRTSTPYAARPCRSHLHANSSRLTNLVKRTLFKAVEENDLVRAKRKVQEDPKAVYEKQAFSRNTILHCLAGTSSVDSIGLREEKKPTQEMISFILSMYSQVDIPNVWDETPLIIACQTNFVDVARRLIAAGANPNYVPAVGEPPLHTLLSTSFTTTIGFAEELFYRGAFINLPDAQGRTPLSYLIQAHAEDPISSNYQKIRWLLSRNATVVTKTEDLYKLCVADPYLSSTPIKNLAPLLLSCHPEKDKL